MSSNHHDEFLLSLVAIFNPSLLAAVTVMLLLPNPKRLMLGYVLGAYTTSITLGLLIVFSLHGSSTESTSKHTISPAEDIAIGLLLLLIAWILRTGRDQPLQEAPTGQAGGEAAGQTGGRQADRVAAVAPAWQG